MAFSKCLRVTLFAVSNKGDFCSPNINVFVSINIRLKKRDMLLQAFKSTGYDPNRG